MASLLTEIYVSVDGVEFTKLDLFKDESFTIKHSKKDVQDLSKVFAPFSQPFSFPATPKNKKALGFFGSTQAVKTNPDNKFKCKVYTNGIINQTGILKIENIKYKNNKAETFTGGFSTQILSLKDRIGTDTIDNISDTPVLFDWKPINVKSSTEGVNITYGVKYYIPLVSNNRVWNYDLEETGVDNIAYKTGLNPSEDKVINIGELRPSVNLVSLLNLIKTKYDLNITTPLENQSELKEVYIWCNGKNFATPTPSKFIATKQYTNESPSDHGTTVNNLTDSSTKITKNGDVTFIRYRLRLKKLVIGDNLATASLTISIVKKSTLETVLSFDFEAVNGENEFDMIIPLYLFTSNQFEFFTYVQFSKPVFWKFADCNVLYRRNAFYGDKISRYDNANNSDLTACHKIDLLKSLPNVKVIDFLTSFFKTFNISIFDNSPSNENLLFLTPQDTDSADQSYSKAVLDYTTFADGKDVEKKVNNPYNYYNFKHKTSAYRSNIDFKKQFNIEYGQTYFPATKPDKANEYKIETEFSIIPPVTINGTANVYTAYGFNSDAPEIDEDGRFRYSPNLDELTLFYSHGNTSLGSQTLAMQMNNSANDLVLSQLSSYVKSMPFCKQNNFSLAFSILVINNVSYTETLYSRYYSKLIARLLNPNALLQTINFILPSTEIYLNDANIASGAGLTPKGFRLQNEIIVGETRFEIIEASIDTTTGKTKLTLLNF